MRLRMGVCANKRKKLFDRIYATTNANGMHSLVQTIAGSSAWWTRRNDDIVIAMRSFGIR